MNEFYKQTNPTAIQIYCPYSIAVKLTSILFYALCSHAPCDAYKAGTYKVRGVFWN